MPPVLFRKWAGAAPAKPKQNGSGAVPYGLDFEEGQEEALGSTVHRSFLGFSQESTKRTQEEPPAGVILKDGRTAALATTRSDWGSPDWKCLTSNYSSSCNEKALARYHRRKIKSKELCQQQREERWVKCFRRWEKRDATTVTSTEFSILPAGWHIDGRPLPVGIPPKPKAAAQILAEAQAAKAAKGASMPCAKECPALSVGAAGPVALRAETPEVDLALPTRAPTPSTPARSRVVTPDDETGEHLHLIRGSIKPLAPLPEPLTRSNFKKAGELRYAESGSSSTISSRRSMTRRIHGWGFDRGSHSSGRSDFSAIG